MASSVEDDMVEDDSGADGEPASRLRMCGIVALLKHSIFASEGVEYADDEASEGETEGASQESSISSRTGLANAMAKILSQDVGERKVRAHSAQCFCLRALT